MLLLSQSAVLSGNSQTFPIMPWGLAESNCYVWLKKNCSCLDLLYTEIHDRVILYCQCLHDIRASRHRVTQKSNRHTLWSILCSSPESIVCLFHMLYNLYLIRWAHWDQDPLCKRERKASETMQTSIIDWIVKPASAARRSRFKILCN